MGYRLLEQFEAEMAGQVYRHRVSTVGDRIAAMVYEDLAGMDPEHGSKKLVQRLHDRSRVRNTNNTAVGLRSRRPDGAMGELIPGEKFKVAPETLVAMGPAANFEIGVEVKILAKAMIKQIDRVISDLRRQVEHFRHDGPHCITIGIIGVNHADHYVGFEGDRPYPTTAKGGNPHPSQEAEEAIRRVKERAAPDFDEFIVLRFKATNEAPFPFSWVSPAEARQQYGAALVRIARKYDQRFG